MMKKLTKLFALLIATTSLVACSANAINGKEDMNVDVIDTESRREFIDLLDYELQNRAFALKLMEAAVEKGSGNEALPFLKAYLALEKLNQRHFASVAKEYNLDMKPRWWTRTRTTLALLGTALLPETSLKSVHKATVKYVAQLQRLESLSAEQHKRFFRYVVAQEQAQADAVGLVLAGDMEQGASLLNDFVQEYQNHTFN
ncbi:hypothetical protein HBA55_21585 [Pseudomaricurvus alkylphenolicus]|uniref:hypothetical protein n=1 Tax=Pseudomaricurvus alkylphenolicus TaxID=1306991 RepID=UPI001422EB49|nr:hypothetical protein [Pseudomaricurvus alkylphenolicus]NIB42214.1 hypothetical protein [Pseudomaricurvus alkylphenolicus]